MVPDLGSRVGPYRVIRRIGSGGMGTVLLAEDTRLRRSVALKTISDPDNVTPQARQRLLHEARAAAALSHPHIAAVHDVLDTGDQVVIVFEYVDGETLAATLRQGPLPLSRAVDVALELADALDAAHRRSIVHRDLKPANVILTPQGRAVVLDFGIARLLPTAEGTTSTGDPGSAAGGLIGTPGYAAPEQWAGQHADARSDLYSLGVVLFEMIAGRRPFEEPDVMALGQAVVTRKAPRLSSVARVPHDLDALVSALLARGPGDRPQSAREVIEALRPIRTGLAASPSAHVPAAQWQRKDRMRRRGFAAAGLLGAAAFVPMVLWQGGDRPPADARPPVVAVLPLSMAGAEGDEDYLAAGIAESLIVRLAALPSITVLSRSAVADARALQPDLRRLSRDLDAAYLVETGVQQSGDRLRITLNLVRRDGSVAWADSFEGTFERIFDLQARIVTAVSQALQVRVSAEERARMADQPTADPEALAAYWRGRALLERRDVPGNVDRALAAFQRAVEVDPGFAGARAALGEAWWARYTITRDPQAAANAADAGAMALRIAPDEAPVRYAMALTLAGSGRPGEAIEELRRALALRPNYDDARRRLGLVLAGQGRIDEAVEEFQKAIALRPNYWGSWSEMGVVLYQAARYDEAIVAFQKVVDLQPDNHTGHQQLGTVYQALGNRAAAIEAYEQAIAIRPSFGAYANIGALRHAEGNYAAAIVAYEESLRLRPQSPAVLRNIGDAHRRMGQNAQARDAYRRAVGAVEAELRVNPRDARNLSALAVYLAKLGEHGPAAQRLDEAAAIAPGDVQVRYRAAVVHALGGQTAASLLALEEALRAGYSRVQARGDEDLASLHALPAFAALVNPE